MDNIYLELKEIAATQINIDTEDNLASRKINILLPLIETLGYTTLKKDNVYNDPICNVDGTFSITYALACATGIRAFVKVYDKDEDLTQDLNTIKDLVANETAKYLMVTDCFEYNIYGIGRNGDEVILDFIRSFNILSMTDEDVEVLHLLDKPAELVERQASAFPEEATEPAPVTEKKSRVGLLIIIGAIIIALLTGLLLSKTVWTDSNKPGVVDSLDYIDVDSNLSVAQTNGQLKIELYSNDLPEDAVVKFVIKNYNDNETSSSSDEAYGTVDDDGKVSAVYDIPMEWEYPNISVVAYLRFDESNHPQPESVTEKFGKNGNKLMGKDGAPDKYALNFANVKYDSEAVRAYLTSLAEREELEARAKREKDFANFEIRTDSAGNIKVLPKGYSMDEVNITESRNIYPQIFYNAQENQSYFYLVCGFRGQNWSMFSNVAFYADGYNWDNDINSNVRKQQVTGGYITEWVYFNHIDIPNLINDATLIANSNTAKVSFSGYSKKEHAVSPSEKTAIANMLYFYNTYFGSGTKVPDIAWFSENYEKTYDLSYIVEPDSMKERDYTEQNTINTLSATINNLRAAGKSVPVADQTKLNTLSSKYKVLSDDMVSRIMQSMKVANATTAFDADYENSGLPYYKIYFDYKNQGELTAGYVPYMYIMNDKTVYVRIKNTESDTDKSFARYTMKDELFTDLMKEINSASYTN